MDAVTLLRQSLESAHSFLEDTMGELSPEQLHYRPEGHALPLGAAYAHTVFTEDILIQGMVKGEMPIVAKMGEAAGVSEPMPDFAPEAWAGYEAWTRRVKVDMPALRRYAKQVYDASDAYLATLKDSDLDRPVDLSGFNLGTQSLGWFLSRIVVAHADNLTGEISAIKGVQGLKGYPV